MKEKKLVIVGDSAFAEIAFEYFTYDSDYEVVAFAVEREFLKRDSLFGLPVVALEDLETIHPPESHSVFVATVYTQLNRLRTRLVAWCEMQGYALASYISPRAFVWRNVKIGPHCFIFENNVVQPFVTLGKNVVLWSGNHIGHHSTIADNVFVSSHVVVSGFCSIGANCFLGVNAAIANNITVAEDCWVGPGAAIGQNTEAGQVIRGAEPTVAKVSALRLFKVPKVTSEG